MRSPKQNDFGTGKIWKILLKQAVPLTVAQLVQLLYNIVDRIYLGHLAEIGNMALTGVGLTFPVITIIAAFTNLCSSGGVPLFSISRGEKERERAENILGNTCAMLLLLGAALMVLCYLFKKPILYAFGASDESYIYANQYLRIYLLGTIFSMFTTGLNGFINAQGFPRMGMLTTIIGAVANIILDPVFIFALNLGVKGAAIATVISQFISAAWVFRFITGEKTEIRLMLKCMKLIPALMKKIAFLGLSGFIVQFTNAAVQVACNSTLQIYGGDLYVGIMTVINSVREIGNLPVSGIASGSQPVIGYAYGAKQYDRLKESIRVSAFMGIAYTVFFWALILIIPGPIMKIFTSDAAMLESGIPALRIYFFGFCFMALQFTGQHTFQALGFARRSIFFSLLRKIIIVVPLALILPRLGMGVMGVFVAEPISNVLGGSASFLTMYFTVYRRLGTDQKLLRENK